MSTDYSKLGGRGWLSRDPWVACRQHARAASLKATLPGSETGSKQGRGGLRDADAGTLLIRERPSQGTRGEMGDVGCGW